MIKKRKKYAKCQKAARKKSEYDNSILLTLLAGRIIFYPMNKNNIAQIIKRIRQAENLRQVEVAEMLGSSQGHITHIETGRGMMSLDMFVALVSRLGYKAEIEDGKIAVYKKIG